MFLLLRLPRRWFVAGCGGLCGVSKACSRHPGPSLHGHGCHDIVFRVLPLVLLLEQEHHHLIASARYLPQGACSQIQQEGDRGKGEQGPHLRLHPEKLSRASSSRQTQHSTYPIPDNRILPVLRSSFLGQPQWAGRRLDENLSLEQLLVCF